jgi:SWIB/MDM2 domain
MAATISCRNAVHDITQGLGQPRVNPPSIAVGTLFETYTCRSPANCLLVTLFTVTGVTNKYPALRHPNHQVLEVPGGENDLGALPEVPKKRNKREILADEKLQHIFGAKKMGMFQMTKAVNKHLK